MKAEAWVLYAANSGKNGLHRETLDISPPVEDELVVEPVYGSWEGNMGHALDRSPIDICRRRGEEKVVLGNAGVSKVVAIGPEVRSTKVGDYVISGGGGPLEDNYGHAHAVFGYDAPGTQGYLSTTTKIHERWAARIPSSTRFHLARWAAFNVRYCTAWHNWKLAELVYRAQVPEIRKPRLRVWGWGGGTTLATLDLAQRFGHDVKIFCGNDRRIADCEMAGVPVIDRRTLGGLNAYGKEHRSKERRGEIKQEVQAFSKFVEESTNGEMVDIFVDYIGDPVQRFTDTALASPAVVTTAGWKEGMKLRYLRAVNCIKRRQLVHTHWSTREDVEEAIQFAEENEWLPQVSPEDIVAFEDVPQLASDSKNGSLGLFPCYEVNAVH